MLSIDTVQKTFKLLHTKIFHLRLPYVLFPSNILILGGEIIMNKKAHVQYGRWHEMMGRCHNPNHKLYKYYGAKGVTVHERWHDFWNFVEDIDNHLLNGHLLYQSRLEWQLDKDIKGGNIYSLENCTVVTAEKNRREAYEKQRRKIIAYDDTKEIEFESVSEASRQLNIDRNGIQYCLKNSWQNKSTGLRFKYKIDEISVDLHSNSV